MSTNSISALSQSAILLLTSLIAGASANAQQAAPAGSDAPILQALVTEVRQLRLAIERTNSVSSRLQITLQRIQLQQNRVNNISGQLESVRREIAKSEAELADLSNHLADFDNRLEKEQDPNHLKALQEQQKDAKAILKQRTRTIQDQRAREGELAGSLQTEQGKLSELEEHLDSLDKLIEPQQAQ